MNWQLSVGAINKDECETIISRCKATLPMQNATTFSSNDNAGRKTQVAWTDDQKLMEIATYYTLAANRNAFGVELGYMPPLQFGEYAVGGHYDWHHDVNWENDTKYDRKLSIVIQLSDPNTYEGGEFEFREIEKPLAFRTQGSVLVFPSYLMHRVLPVTQGTRYSLVGWMEGPRWK
jgi:PKHD-type hydroxylase